ncbi:stationary phase survival protein SurE [Marinomonas ushuaiensis DSM 15871]|uniref:5'-nucleotidase SurE n=1 Tax=Marinomonas ushuaiensis DSM 15871 TaxID=1122207 RepID=X7E6B9_9GAMM|nr:5'/3'-nucleotidase SurE [Marinomonas ushuaiensis]ETX10736.1 stationary phase survival protein SurE [Marinomonas ushuaiensis DSM 15871]
MRILIANDDGIDAVGIQILVKRLQQDYAVLVVAPDRNHSGASNSLTLNRPLQPVKVAGNQYRVDGTPTDCVNLALSGLIDGEVDLVVSGVNHGANLGDDVIYSGTVAAAMEARHLGRPALAVSLVGNEHFDTAAEVVMRLLKDAHTLSVPAGILLNVNVPDLPYDELKGIQVTRLGYRHQAQAPISAQHPKGLPSFWIGALSEPHDASEGTDFFAVENGYVSITPIHTDMTCYEAKSSLEQWTDTVNL